MPVLIRDTPLGREWFEEGLAQGREEGRRSVVRVLLRQRFGEDPRLDRAAAALAHLTDDDLLPRLDTATSLDDLTG